MGMGQRAHSGKVPKSTGPVRCVRTRAFSWERVNQERGQSLEPSIVLRVGADDQWQGEGGGGVNYKGGVRFARCHFQVNSVVVLAKCGYGEGMGSVESESEMSAAGGLSKDNISRELASSAERIPQDLCLRPMTLSFLWSGREGG